MSKSFGLHSIYYYYYLFSFCSNQIVTADFKSKTYQR
jgi:hypothetical protein